MKTPATYEDITIQWLNDVLTESGFLESTRIIDFDISPLGAELGFLGFLYRISPTYADEVGLPVSLVIKFPSTEPGARASGLGLRAYERESCFYRDCANTIKPCSAPASYYSYVDVAEDEYITIMEDLAGARFVNQVDGVNKEDALQCFLALADMHARFWDNTEDVAWAPLFSEYGAMYQPLIDSGGPQLMDNWSHMMPDTLKNHMDRGQASYPKITAALGELPMTLIHGDPRIENVAFDGQIPRFYDWQLTSRGPAAYDLMYFLKQSMDVELKRQHQEILLDAYLQRLNDAGVKYTMEALLDDLALASCTIWGFSAMIGNFVFPSEVNNKLVQTTMPRYAGVIDDFGGIARLDNITART